MKEKSKLKAKKVIKTDEAQAPKSKSKPTSKPKNAGQLLKDYSKESAGKDGATKIKLKVKLKKNLADLKKK